MDDSKILNLRFSQDCGCFAASMESGLKIYYLEPLMKKSSYDVDTVGGIGLCEMLHQTSLIAIVSGGSRPKNSYNILQVYEDTEKKCILEMKFRSAVKSVRLRKDKLVVVLANKIHVFTFFHPLKEICTIETRNNLKGLCEISPLQSSQRQILVFPGPKLGSVQIMELSSIQQSYSSAHVYIEAHRNELACIAINQQGTRIATASENGTLIRVWDSCARNKLVELRRGSDPAIIQCISFSQDSEFLCCSSDKGTVHIFAIKDTNRNRRMSSLPPAIRGSLGQYGESQWGLATFSVSTECACVCAFGPNNSVYALGLDGSFHKLAFTGDGSCHVEAFDVFLDLDDDDDKF